MRYGAIHVFADASVKPNMTGLGLAVKDAGGHLIAWRGKRGPAMTCVEAEYAALIFALEQALGFDSGEVCVYSDSRVVVEQMQGVINVNSDTLRGLHHTARKLALRFERIHFMHIRRGLNELADAMAEDVCHSWGVRGGARDGQMRRADTSGIGGS